MNPAGDWKLQTKILPADQPSSIYRAVVQITQGGLVAFPTDTVFGLGAAVTNPEAIDQLYQVKGRESTKAIPVLIGRLDDLSLVTSSVNETVQRLIHVFWPGPLTLVVPRLALLPSILSPSPTIGVRMPDHPVAVDLLCRTGPLAVTSANLSGQPNTTTASEVFSQLRGRIELILDGGKTPEGQPSTVVDCTGPELVVIRQGLITLEQLLSTVNQYKQSLNPFLHTSPFLG